MTALDGAHTIGIGQMLLLACGIAYLFWWTVYFLPDHQLSSSVRILGGISIAIAAIAGLAGVALMSRGVGMLPSQANAATGISGTHILLCGIVLYVVLLLVTRGTFHRPVTTELVLLVGWAALELFVINSLVCAGMLSGGRLVFQICLVIVIEALCIVCYTLYYSLAPWPSFIDGCIPLAAVGLASAVLGLSLLVG